MSDACDFLKEEQIYCLLAQKFSKIAGLLPDDENFPFRIGGSKFHSVIEYVWHCQLEYFGISSNSGRSSIKSRFLDSKISPSEIEAWAKRSLSHVLHRAYEAKFLVHSDLKQILLETGDDLLAFISSDRQMGSGMNPVRLLELMTIKGFNPSNPLKIWPSDPRLGANRVGIALMELRSEFQIEMELMKNREAALVAAEDVLEIQDHIASSAAAADEFSPEMVDVSSGIEEIPDGLVSEIPAESQSPAGSETESPVGSPIPPTFGAVENVYGLENPLSEVHMEPLFIDGGFYPSVLHYVYYKVLCVQMRQAQMPQNFQRKWAEKILSADSIRSLQRAFRELLQHFRKRTGMEKLEFSIETSMPDLLMTGFRAKFDQYENAYNALLDSGENVLVSW